MREKIRIVLWAPLGAGTHYWGPGISAFRLFSYAGDEVEIDLVHGYPGQEDNGIYKESICLGDLRGLNIIKLSRFLYNAKKWLRKNAEKYDVFYGLSAFEYTVRPALWAENLGLPAVIKTTGLGSGIQNAKGLRKLIGLQRKRRKMLLKCSGVIAISSEIVKNLRDSGLSRQQIWHIPNGVNTTYYSPIGSLEEKRLLRQRLNIPDRFTILFVGGMSSRKQPDVILDVLRSLKELGCGDIQAVFVGPEREKGYLNWFKKKVIEFDLEDSVHWRGHVDEVGVYYKAGDIFLLLSKHEGMSNALLEALATGLPSIVTDVSGSRDLVKHGVNGYILSDLQEQKVAKLIFSYVEDKNLYNSHSTAAREHIVNGFSYGVVWRELKTKIENNITLKG